MGTKRGKKIQITSKGLEQERTRTKIYDQTQKTKPRSLEDDDDHLSTCARRTLSSNMPSFNPSVSTSLSHLRASNYPRRQLRTKFYNKTNPLSLSHPTSGILPFLLLCASAILPAARADQNVTVDDQDPSIVYSPTGAWTLSANSSLDIGGAHMLTQNPNATAVFKFTGIAVYYLAPLWPYTVNTAVSLDSGNATLIDLVDHSRTSTGQGPETVQSGVVWSATGLENEPHVLTISVGSGQPFGVVDAIMYTNTNPASSSSSSTQTSTTDRVVASSTTTPLNTSTTSLSKHILPVALGTAFGILALFLLMIAMWFFFRNRKRKRPISEWTVDGTAFSGAGAEGGHNGRYVTPTPSHPQGKGGWDLNAQGAGWYSNGNGYGYPMEQTQQGTWQNSRYGNVGMPAPAVPAQDMSRAPNRYTPGYTLSTITEKSTPKMVDGGLRTPVGAGAHSPASVQTTGSELPDMGEYSTAPGSRASLAGVTTYQNASNVVAGASGGAGGSVNGRAAHRPGGATSRQHYPKPTGNWL